MKQQSSKSPTSRVEKPKEPIQNSGFSAKNYSPAQCLPNFKGDASLMVSPFYHNSGFSDHQQFHQNNIGYFNYQQNYQMQNFYRGDPESPVKQNRDQILPVSAFMDHGQNFKSLLRSGAGYCGNSYGTHINLMTEAGPNNNAISCFEDGHDKRPQKIVIQTPNVPIVQTPTAQGQANKELMNARTVKNSQPLIQLQSLQATNSNCEQDSKLESENNQQNLNYQRQSERVSKISPQQDKNLIKIEEEDLKFGKGYFCNEYQELNKILKERVIEPLEEENKLLYESVLDIFQLGDDFESESDDESVIQSIKESHMAKERQNLNQQSLSFFPQNDPLEKQFVLHFAQVTNGDSNLTRIEQIEKDVNEIQFRLTQLLPENNAEFNIFDQNFSNDVFPSVKMYQCKFCPQFFNQSCSLGGHISRVHKGESANYQQRLAIRNKRTSQRERKNFIKQKFSQRKISDSSDSEDEKDIT